MSLQSGCLDRAYFEITSVCNAACRFCPGTVRPPRFVSDEEFDTVIGALRGRVTYLYFHLMGEPLLHPSVLDFAHRAQVAGFRVMITSNGILATEVGIPLVKTGAIHKISLSLHSYEANSFPLPMEEYLSHCFRLAKEASRVGTISVLRLWNRGGEEEKNREILDGMRRYFGNEWHPTRSGYRLADHIFLEWGEHFTWPQQAGAADAPHFCHALRNQIGILSDGTVVPCCLDAEGSIPLGNLFADSLDTVLSSPRAKALYDGFSSHQAVESLCHHCGYASRFQR